MANSNGTRIKKYIYTAFTTPDGGLYHFNIVCFGLKNAPASFQRLMSLEVLTEILHKFCIVYLGDIIIYSRNYENRLYHLTIILGWLKQHNFKIATEKCVLRNTELDYLGHKIDGEITKPMSKHLTQLPELKKPKNKKELRSLLGICNWVRDYIPNFALISARLTDLLKNNKCKWTADAESALTKLKEVFTKPITLARPIPGAHCPLQTDARGKGIAVMLYQTAPDGTRSIIITAAPSFPPLSKNITYTNKSV